MRLSQNELLVLAMMRGMTSDARTMLTRIADPVGAPVTPADFAAAVDRGVRRVTRTDPVRRGVILSFGGAAVAQRGNR